MRRLVELVLGPDVPGETECLVGCGVCFVAMYVAPSAPVNWAGVGGLGAFFWMFLSARGM